MENDVCGIKLSMYEVNLCLRLSVELHENLVTLQLHDLLAKKAKNHH